MACCGPSISNIDSEKLLKELRNNREIIPLKLNEASYGFHPKSSKWKSNEYIIYYLYNYYRKFRKIFNIKYGR